MNKENLPHLFFLHGFMGSPNDWEFVANAFPNYQLHLLDLNALSSFDEVVRHINSIVEEYGVERYALIGYSMGGRIAWYCATRLAVPPTITMVESSAPGLIEAQSIAERINIEKQWANAISAQGLPKFLSNWYAMPLFNSLSDQQRHVLIQRRSKQKPKEIVAQLARYSIIKQPYLLADSQCPPNLVYLYGERDPKYTNISHVLRSKGMHTIAFPTAGHQPHFECPTEFIEQLEILLTNFLPNE